MKRILLFVLIIGALASCKKQTHTPQPDRSFQLSANSLTLDAGTTGALSSNKYSTSELNWSSSDSTIATVDTTGLITALKSGSVIITAKQKTYNVSATCSVAVNVAKFTDVGVGADGSVFAIGATPVPSIGGFNVFKIVNGEMHKLPDCSAVRVAVSPQGVPWVITSSNQVLKYVNGAWQTMPGNASDIGIGADGSIFAISTVVYSPSGGFTILKWNGSAFTTMTDCSGIHIAVGPNGIPWVVNKSNVVFQYSGTVLWNLMPGVSANDIAIGTDGQVYVTNASSGVAGYQPPIFKYNSTNATWAQLPGIFGTSISASSAGKIWWIDETGLLHNQ